MNEILDYIPKFLWRVFGATVESHGRKAGFQSAYINGKFYIIDRVTGEPISSDNGVVYKK